MAMAPSDYIKVAMDATEYDEFNNGVVTPEGALVSTKALADGSYNVIAWAGDSGTAPLMQRYGGQRWHYSHPDWSCFHCEIAKHSGQNVPN